MRVLVLRPCAAAERTARRLAMHGHEAVLAPVLRIERTDEAPPPGAFAAVILTSANAVPALAGVAERFKGLPVFAVGERTRSAALAAEFCEVHVAEGDAAALAALIKRTLPAGASLLHVAGRERKPDPEASLAAAGFSVSSWAAYDAVPVQGFPADAQSALGKARLDAALHYSRRSAGVALDLAARADVMAPFLALTHVCLSADCAVPLQAAGAPRVRVAGHPDEASVLAALAECAREIDDTGSRRPSSKC